MSEKRRAPESVMRDLCEAVEAYERRVDDLSLPEAPETKALAKALSAYRAAAAPLRTRQEVDAEIAETVRDICEYNGTIPAIMPIDGQQKLKRLCSEPTADEPAPREPTRSEPTAEPCGCEESEALRARIAAAIQELSRSHQCDAMRAAPEKLRD